VRIPLLEARLLAIDDELSSRAGRLVCARDGGVCRGEEARGPRSDLDARSSATAADVDIGFSVTLCTSTSVAVEVGGFSEG
jgi:hypothetical protein